MRVVQAIWLAGFLLPRDEASRNDRLEMALLVQAWRPMMRVVRWPWLLCVVAPLTFGAGAHFDAPPSQPLRLAQAAKARPPLPSFRRRRTFRRPPGRGSVRTRDPRSRTTAFA